MLNDQIQILKNKFRISYPKILRWLFLTISECPLYWRTSWRTIVDILKNFLNAKFVFKNNWKEIWKKILHFEFLRIFLKCHRTKVRGASQKNKWSPDQKSNIFSFSSWRTFEFLLGLESKHMLECVWNSYNIF